MADNHIHSTFSDGQDEPEDMIRAALSLGISCLCFTDHARKESDYIPTYLGELEKLKKKYRDRDITIGKGLEVKFIDEQGNIDFNLLWAHRLDNLIISFHKFPGEVYQNKGQLEFKKTWFETLRGFTRKHLIILKQENPKLRVILGHPFSMWLKLGLFPEQNEVSRLIALANQAGFGLEINVNPKHRLNDEYIQLIVNSCSIISWGTDSHSCLELANNSSSLLEARQLYGGIKSGYYDSAEGNGSNRYSI
ncbi:PHP domain-containing protein [Moorella sulfitireducens]|uniref:PHP domain-containing protein n=1 Tax=Neomoorella sulfitireducens TaxID=2972948 RepID=UPI0021ABFCA9|nr:PHP domain-containing protein [Moorella sulfitireducens]